MTMPWTVARPRPVPLPSSLVVKNGSNRRLNLVRHAGAGIGYREHHVLPRLHGKVLAGVILVEIDVRGFDRQRAAVGHGIAGVHGEIEDDLLDLSAIRFHYRQLGPQIENDLDVFSDETLEKISHA